MGGVGFTGIYRLVYGRGGVHGYLYADLWEGWGSRVFIGWFMGGVGFTGIYRLVYGRGGVHGYLYADLWEGWGSRVFIG